MLKRGKMNEMSVHYEGLCSVFGHNHPWTENVFTSNNTDHSCASLQVFFTSRFASAVRMTYDLLSIPVHWMQWLFLWLIISVWLYALPLHLTASVALFCQLSLAYLIISIWDTSVGVLLCLRFICPHLISIDTTTRSGNKVLSTYHLCKCHTYVWLFGLHRYSENIWGPFR